jgi:hypothetical protein
MVADYFLRDTIQQIKEQYPTYRTDIWNVETTLCAYYKYLHGKRYVGFYRDRQMDEINIMEINTRGSGVCWDVLHDFRKEYKPYLNTIREDV